LGAGVLYGFYHQSSLSASAKVAAVNREYEHKQKLIEQAKAEYSKKNLPAGSKTTEGDGMFGQIFFPLAAEPMPADEMLQSCRWILQYIEFLVI
jgi:hypothetical protein